MLPLLVIIYSYNFVQRDLPPYSVRRIERETERDGARGSERACARGTRVCQCLPVSTPTYLCKSFNLTPPACRANPERDRISKPIRIHCLDGGETRCAAPHRAAPRRAEPSRGKPHRCVESRPPSARIYRISPPTAHCHALSISWEALLPTRESPRRGSLKVTVVNRAGARARDPSGLVLSFRFRI